MEVSYTVMGQKEVILFLKKQEEELSALEISRLMGEPSSKIFKILSILVKTGEVSMREIDREEARKRTGSYRRSTLYSI